MIRMIFVATTMLGTTAALAQSDPAPATATGTQHTTTIHHASTVRHTVHHGSTRRPATHRTVVHHTTATPTGQTSTTSDTTTTSSQDTSDGAAPASQPQ